ncbi:MAG: extracellular solute-binding protein, partial [Clostridia bacterium]|nr:extracellular solute-binding protein [Clostridia bacterium]
ATSNRISRWRGATEFELGAIEMPFFKTQSLALGGNVMVILTDDPQKVEAAWEYISYLTSAEKNAEFALATGYLPIRKSELDNADIQKALSENELYAIAFKQLDYTFAYTHFEQMGTMDSLLRNMLNKLEKNRGTSQDLLDKAAKDLKSEIDEG